MADRDYEALIRELLAGVAGGWSYGNVIVLLMTKGVDETELALWLTKFAEGLSLERDGEIIEQIKLLGKMTPGRFAADAFLVGAKFDRSYRQDSELLNHQAWLDRGDELFELGKYEEAISSYDQVIESNPDNYKACFNRGAALYNLGQYAEAIASYDRAIEINPDSYEAWFSRGNVLNDLGKCAEAIASYDRAIEINPDDHEAWSNRGFALGNLGQYAEAIASYDRAIKIKPDFYEVWYDRGIALANLGQYAEAISSYDQAIEIKLDYYEAWYNRSFMLQDLGRYEESIDSFDRAIQIKPNDHAWNNRGFALLNLGRYEQSIDSFDRAIKFQPDNYCAWGNRGTALCDLGRYEEALESFDRDIQIAPENHKSWCNRGNMLSRLDRYEEAINSYKKAIEFQSDSYQAWCGLAFAFNITKDYQTELDTHNQAFQYIRLDTHPEGWGFLQRRIGLAHFQEGTNQLLNCFKKPQPYYALALTAYNNALQTLTREQFPQLRLETLIDIAHTQLAQRNPEAAHQSKLEAWNIFRDLLNAQPTFEGKNRLKLKYISLYQLDVELFIATGDNIRALEAAELDKNERLTLLLAALQEQTISPTHTEMRQLLTSDTTGIIYWHLSPDHLTTFILTSAATQPLFWNIDNRALQAHQLKDWIKAWDTQYTDYREHKSPKTHPHPNDRTTDNSKADLPWRSNLTANLLQLKQILDIDNICKQLPAHLTNLILVPHGDLHRFPLHILFLIAQKSQIRGCTYIPSIQVGLNLRDRSSRSYTPLLSVADPATDAEPIPFAQLESAIVRHLLQPHTSIDPHDADLTTVTTALSQPHAAFHFTGHAAYNSRKPADSALALTDAPLTAQHIAQLNLSSYNLITLAACETAIAGRTNITTEYVGLTSAFLHAGAANILSTLWQVDEISNAWFTIYFHQQLLAGRSPGVALTITQIWMKDVTWQRLINWLRELKQLSNLKIGIVDKIEARIRNIEEDEGTIGLDRPTKYSHPYYWAAFTITGRG